MIQLQVPDGTAVSLKGEPDGGFLEYVRDVCPELWQDVLRLKDDQHLLLDLINNEVRLGPAEGMRRVAPTREWERLLQDLRIVASLSIK